VTDASPDHRPAPGRPIDLTVLGAGPAYTNRPGATGAAYLVQASGSALLLDLGQGSFPRLAAAIEPSTLDGVVISHLHPDHFIDLVPLRHYLVYQFDPPRRIRVAAPAGLAERIDALHASRGFTAASLDVEALETAQDVSAAVRDDAGTPTAVLRFGAFTVEARRVTHTADSHAVRVSLTDAPDAAGLVYSGDCGRAADLVPLIRPGDALLIEVSFGVGPVPAGAQHLDAPAIASLVSATRPGQILLTHLQMGFDGDDAMAVVRAATDVPIQLVEPGDRTSIGGT
jgi:ribonuclease BN (tRNA processing enzyme)